MARPTPAPPPAAPAPEVPAQRGSEIWPWLAIASALLLAIAAWASRRRRLAKQSGGRAGDLLPEPPARSPVIRPVPPIGPLASIAIALRPNRAGLNMLSAVVEGEVIVTNVGDAAAGQVRVYATLLSAHAAHDADLAATFTAPAGRPVTPPFALAAGEERRVRVVVALPREALRSMEAGGRPMFVPLVAVDVRYTADAEGPAAQAGQAFIIGVERVDSAKLAPFWLDGPLKMQDQIAARAHGALLVR